jgi:hypothetical protein
MHLIFTDFLSVIAIVLSLIAILQVMAIRTRDMTINALNDLDLIRAGLSTAEVRISWASQQWQSAFASRGMSQPEAMKQKLQEIEELRTRTGQLSQELEDMQLLVVPIKSSFSIDLATRVKNIFLQWELLSSDIDFLVTDAKENRAVLNRK